jgi:hypothetical protein
MLPNAKRPDFAGKSGLLSAKIVGQRLLAPNYLGASVVVVVVVEPAAGAAASVVAPAVVPAVVPAASVVVAPAVVPAASVPVAVAEESVAVAPAAVLSVEVLSVEEVLSAVLDSQEARPRARNRADTFSRFFILVVGLKCSLV